MPPPRTSQVRAASRGPSSRDRRPPGQRSRTRSRRPGPRPKPPVARGGPSPAAVRRPEDREYSRDRALTQDLQPFHHRDEDRGEREHEANQSADHVVTALPLQWVEDLLGQPASPEPAQNGPA